MKNTLLFVGILILTVPSLNAQSDRFSQDFQPIRSELTKWDPIRGEWLASSLVAMSKQEAIPDRTFPEDFTPAEMMRMVPASNMANIQQTASANQRIATDSTGRNEWNVISSVVDRPTCKPIMGRTYGDPHLVSFDGASYSFQTVGEFVLAKSVSQNLEIQARQQPQSDDFSLNTAVAMNVAGDRVAIYANEKPDNISNTALRINGAPVNISRNTYFLPHGGTIRYSSNSYVITWPTGEVVNAQIRNSSRMNFINVTVQVYPCAQNDLQGLLGNANGQKNDDFETRTASNRPAYMAFSSFGNEQMERASNAAEKEYLAFLARDYARDFRVTHTTTLFDYGFGQNTLSYTDESFPRVHRTVGDLSNDRQEAARRNCEGQGVGTDEMRGCIYDNAYLEIPPSPRPTIKDPTSGVVLARVEKPIKNVNPKPNGTIGEIEKDKNTDVTPTVGSKGSTESEIKEPIQVSDDNVGPKEPKPSTTKPPGTSTKPTIFNTKPEGTILKPSGSTPKPVGTKPKAPSTTVKPVPSTPVKTSPTIKTGKGL